MRQPLINLSMQIVYEFRSVWLTSMSWIWTYRNAKACDFVCLTLSQYPLCKGAVMGLPVCHHDHNFGYALSATILRLESKITAERWLT